MGCISDAQTPRGANEHIFQPELVSTCWHRGGRAFVLIPACRFVRVQLQFSRYERSNSSNSTHNVIRGEQSRKQQHRRRGEREEKKDVSFQVSDLNRLQLSHKTRTIFCVCCKDCLLSFTSQSRHNPNICLPSSRYICCPIPDATYRNMFMLVMKLAGYQLASSETTTAKLFTLFLLRLLTLTLTFQYILSISPKVCHTKHFLAQLQVMCAC